MPHGWLRPVHRGANAPAVLVVDTSRFDQQGTLDDELGQAPRFYRLNLPSLTVLSTVPLDRCDVSG